MQEWLATFVECVLMGENIFFAKINIMSLNIHLKKSLSKACCSSALWECFPWHEWGVHYLYQRFPWSI